MPDFTHFACKMMAITGIKIHLHPIFSKSKKITGFPGSAWRLSPLDPPPAHPPRNIFPSLFEPPSPCSFSVRSAPLWFNSVGPRLSTRSQRSSATLSLDINRRSPRPRLAALALGVRPRSSALQHLFQSDRTAVYVFVLCALCASVVLFR